MIHGPQNLSPRRRRKREARIEAILATAASLLDHAGLEAVTVHAIADAMDMAPGALYRYFTSKDALVAELQRRVLLELSSVLDDVYDHLDPEPDHEFLAAVIVVPAVYAWFSRARRAEFDLLTQSITDPRHLVADREATIVVAAGLDVLQKLADALRAADANGTLECDDPEAAALQLWAAQQGVLQLRKIARLQPDRFEIEEHMRELLDRCFLAMGATQVNLDEAWARVYAIVAERTAYSDVKENPA